MGKRLRVTHKEKSRAKERRNDERDRENER